MRYEKTIICGIIIMVIALSGCMQQAQQVKPETKPKLAPQEPSQDAELKKFASTGELKEFLQKASAGQYDTAMYTMRSDSATAEMVMSSKAAPQAGGAADYSTTNVQVAGVDEADFVKNDDKYIYTIVQDKLVIVDAYPARNAEVLSETELSGRPVNLFLKGNRLAVFTSDNDEIFSIPEYGYMPMPRRSEITRVYIFDVSDKRNPRELEEYKVTGNYYQSRMIGSHVYFITQQGAWGYDLIEPRIESGAKMISPEIYYFDVPYQSYNLNTIASFDINNLADLKAKTFLLGYSTTLMVSEDNIYLAYQKSQGWTWYRDSSEIKFYAAVLPLLPQEARQKIERIRDDKGRTSMEKWDMISGELEEMYNRMEERPKEQLTGKIEESLADYERREEIERRKTVIHRISISNGDIEYEARGEVSGYLLNQFSMDEYKTNLRVATTTEIYVPYKGSEMYNNVYVLDSGLNQIGEIGAIAPDERIYSTRFIGDRLYMVTFKRIDPLFVIDLTNPRDPKILGKLKIPGYSDYLHPYDENHIIGIGKETEGNEWGGVSTGGVKLALFDVSDVEHPRQVDKYEIGDEGSDSEALRDHKAFLFDREKNLLVIPVREVTGSRYRDPRYGYYSQKVWQGAYVFSVDKNRGFEKKGRITHLDGDEDERYWYYSPSAVRRSIFMDDTLYTVSSTKIKMNDIDTVEELGEIELPYSTKYYYDYPWWY